MDEVGLIAARSATLFLLGFNSPRSIVDLDLPRRNLLSYLHIEFGEQPNAPVWIQYPLGPAIRPLP
jgi:hypothetical protein